MSKTMALPFGNRVTEDGRNGMKKLAIQSVAVKVLEAWKSEWRKLGT